MELANLTVTGIIAAVAGLTGIVLSIFARRYAKSDAPGPWNIKTLLDPQVGEAGGFGGRRFFNPPGDTLAALGYSLILPVILLVFLSAAFNSWKAGSYGLAALRVGVALSWLAGAMLIHRRRTHRLGMILILAAMVGFLVRF